MVARLWGFDSLTNRSTTPVEGVIRLLRGEFLKKSGVAIGALVVAPTALAKAKSAPASPVLKDTAQRKAEAEQMLATFEKMPVVPAKPLSTTAIHGLVDDIYTPRQINCPFAMVMAMEGMAERYPLLARAVRNQKAAHSTKVEWLVDRELKHGFSRGYTMVEAEYNYTSIFRWVWSATNCQLASRQYAQGYTLSPAELPARVDPILSGEFGRERLRTLHKMLEGIEASIADGVRSYDTSGAYTRTTMGGVRDILGRKVKETDTLKLWVLRDLCLLTNRQAPDSDSYSEEWLCEISLEAHA